MALEVKTSYLKADSCVPLDPIEQHTHCKSGGQYDDM